jgi:glutaredoxin
MGNNKIRQLMVFTKPGCVFCDYAKVALSRVRNLHKDEIDFEIVTHTVTDNKTPIPKFVKQFTNGQFEERRGFLPYEELCEFLYLTPKVPNKRS